MLDRHPDMLLRREHFAAWRINWDAKSENLRSLARELDVGVDSFVLARRQPHRVRRGPRTLSRGRRAHPSRAPAEIPRFLSNVWAFDRLGRTQEDSRRADFYEQSAAREALRGSSLTFADFIASLDLEVRLFAPAPEHMPRIAQLTQRTNQFNNTTIRRTEPEVKRELASGEVECLAVEVTRPLRRLRAGRRRLLRDTGRRVVGRDRAHELPCSRAWRRTSRPVAGSARSRCSRSCPSPNPVVPTERNQPLLQFLRELGARASSPSQRGRGSGPAVFELDAGDGGACDLRSGPEPRKSSRRRTTQKRRNRARDRMSPFRLDADRFSAIATGIRSAEQILARMAASARRRPARHATAYVAPRTAIEETLADLWAETLRLDRVGVHDDFFELGGSSLQATLLVNRLQEVLGRSFESIVVFDAPTVAGLAELLERQPTAPRRTARRSDLRLASGEGPSLSPSSGCGSSTSSIPAAPSTTSGAPSGFAGPARRRAGRSAQRPRRATRVLAHHVPGDRWSRRAERRRHRGSSASGHGSFEPAGHRPRARRPYVSSPRRTVPSTSRPARCFGRGSCVSTRTTTCCGSSSITSSRTAGPWASSLRELEPLYRARLGVDATLPAARIQYLDFTSWQRERLQERGWRGSRRTGASDSPTRRSWNFRPITPGRRSSPTAARSVPVSIPAELVERLRAVGQRQRATLFMTLMAAFHVLLARHSGQDDIVVGFPIANRNQPEVEGLIGFFVNTLPLRVDLSGNPSFR